MPGPDDLTEADDTLDDDCTCPERCEHERPSRDGGEVACDPACPVHAWR